MDKNVRNAIAITTQDLRKILQDEYFDQLEGLFDILPSGQIAALAGSHLTPAERVTRSKIVGAIDYYRASGFDSTEAVARFVREAAFTSLNRFVALKMLEARELVQECLTNGSDSAGYREFIGLAPGVASLPGGAGYRLYLESLLDELNTDVKILFDRHDAASLLWPRYNSFNKVLAELNRSELADVWVEDETIGWFYQFFNSKEERQSMRDESQAPRTSQELAVRNQFFTPRYVVQFLVDNTLGRLWAEMYGDNDRLSRRCSSLVRIPAAEVRVAMRRDPRDLRIIDPACGSGHFLLYSFDVLLSMYEDAWERDVNAPRSELTGRSLREDYPDLELLRRAAPSLIVEHNLYGVDIDARCSQIAALALWLRVQRAYKDLGIPRDDRPTIAHTHVILAEPMPGDGALVDQFAAQLRPPLLGDLFRTMVNEMNLAGELGLLLQVKEALAAHLQRARKHFLEEQKVAPVLPGMEAPRSEGEPDLSGINDDEFFHQAEDRIVEALARFVEEVAGSVAARRRLFAGDAKQGIALMDVARTEYDVVLMNPPFGLMPRALTSIL